MTADLYPRVHPVQDLGLDKTIVNTTWRVFFFVLPLLRGYDARQLNQTELSKRLEIPQGTVSKALRQLVHKKILLERRHDLAGKWYGLNYGHPLFLYLSDNSRKK